MCPVSIPIRGLRVIFGQMHGYLCHLKQRNNDARDGVLEIFECLILGCHCGCRGSLCLVLLFGHYLEQLGVPHPLIADYRPYFFHFLRFFRSFRDSGM